ncbi:MAG: SHOCT domain-containing protein [Bacteroidota bacterium]
MNKIEQLERLQRLLADGTITKEEFENLKHQAIEEEATSSVHIPPTANNEPPVLKPVVVAPNPEPHDPSHKIYGSSDFVPPVRPQRVTQTTTTTAAPANNMGKILGILALLGAIAAVGYFMFRPTTKIQPAPTVAEQSNSSDKKYNTTSQTNTSADTEDPFDLNEMQVEEANKTTFKTYRGDNVTEPVAYPTDIVKPKETAPIATTSTGTTSTTIKKKGDTASAPQTTTTTTAKKVQEFVSPSGDVKMEIGEDEKGNVTIAGKYREELNTIGGNKNVTYKVLKNNFFVVTGFKGDNVYYRKTIEKDGKFKTFYTEYPKSKKAQIDPITVRMSRSFK